MLGQIYKKKYKKKQYESKYFALFLFVFNK
jgi:hypothetical protein